jgi:FAD/FMN-containing dehydrogenase
VIISQLYLKENLKSDYTLFLETLAKTSFLGEVCADFASQLTMSTDNSIYQILPQAVVFPKTEEDLVHLFDLAQQAQFNNITFSPRGGERQLTVNLFRLVSRSTVLNT